MIVSLLFALTLTADIKRIATGIDGTAGVAAVNLESGKTVDVNGEQGFPMGSVFKFPTGIAVLHHVDRGSLRLDQKVTIKPKDFSPGFSPLRDNAHGKAITLTIRQLVDHAVRVSDNTAADTLIGIIGANDVNRQLRSLGIDAIRVDRTEKQMDRDIHGTLDGVARYAVDPRDTATPNGMLILLVKLARHQLGLSKKSQALLWKMMTDTTTGANRIKSVLPAGAQLAHKTGTMPGTVNDAGVITMPGGKHIAIVVFTKGRKASTDAQAEKVIAGIAKVVIAAIE